MSLKLTNTLLFSTLLTIGTVHATETSSLELKVKTTVTLGTCSAQVMDGDIATNTIALGDVTSSQVIAKTYTKPFKIRFSNCAGLPESKATIKFDRKSGTSCAGSNGPGFRNIGGTSSSIGLELWTTEQPSGADSVQLLCNTPNAQVVDVSTAKGNTNFDYKLSARLFDVSGSGKIGAGTFTSPTTLTITYQ